MMLLFTDLQTGNAVALNPDHVVVLFTTKDETTGEEKVVINTLAGNVVVKESYVEVLGQLQGVK